MAGCKSSLAIKTDSLVFYYMFFIFREVRYKEFIYLPVVNCKLCDAECVWLFVLYVPIHQHKVLQVVDIVYTFEIRINTAFYSVRIQLYQDGSVGVTTLYGRKIFY